MKLVTDGERYAIRRGFFFYDYYDFVCHEFFWCEGSQYFHHCWTDDKERALRVIESLKPRKMWVVDD